MAHRDHCFFLFFLRVSIPLLGLDLTLIRTEPVLPLSTLSRMASSWKNSTAPEKLLLLAYPHSSWVWLLVPCSWGLYLRSLSHIHARVFFSL